MVLNQGDHDNSDDEVVNTAGKVPTDNRVNMCGELIAELEQREFITEQKIMSVYEIKETFLRQKSLLMRLMALEATFKEAIQQNALSSLEELLPSPLAASDVSSHLKKIYTVCNCLLIKIQHHRWRPKASYLLLLW